MSYTSKKSQKNSFNKTKGIDSDRWDHGGFDRLQEERTSTTEGNTKGRKGNKNRGGFNDNKSSINQNEGQEY